MMIGHVLVDFANGIKLLILSGEKLISWKIKVRLFVGGSCLCLVSSFTVFASALYNVAVSKSNPDIIINSIIILFITEIDEKFYRLLSVFSPSWVKKLKAKQTTLATMNRPDDDALKTQVENLKKKVKELKEG